MSTSNRDLPARGPGGAALPLAHRACKRLRPQTGAHGMAYGAGWRTTISATSSATLVDRMPGLAGSSPHYLAVPGTKDQKLAVFHCVCRLAPRSLSNITKEPPRSSMFTSRPPHRTRWTTPLPPCRDFQTSLAPGGSQPRGNSMSGRSPTRTKGLDLLRNGVTSCPPPVPLRRYFSTARGWHAKGCATGQTQRTLAACPQNVAGRRQHDALWRTSSGRRRSVRAVNPTRSRR
jgi:hypothetical protein